MSESRPWIENPQFLAEHCDTDAFNWAESFVSMVKKHNLTIKDLNEDYMLSWFASAITATENAISKQEE